MEPRPGLWPAVALTLLGHGAVLAYLGTAGPKPAPQGAAAPPVMVVRARAVQPDREIAPAPTQPSSPTAIAPEANPAEPAQVAARARRAPPQPQPEPAPQEVPAPQPPATVPEAPYLPRGQLTVAPRLLGIVQVPFPEEVGGIVDLKVQVTLFIDEGGTVQRVRVDTPDVHPAFEQVVRASFGAARFAPGELHQVPVRSQVRLEVGFHAPGSGPSGGSRRSPS